ncbi:sugar phosphate isomerase/epimerase [Streptomyces sp. NBC_00083]|uniref:sugar phosphate isomerase/epimerase family protein n=1 Tax=Streptomyces sp. NBC_00083 TaxID=2975647 RepID=UPI00224CD89B|nr:sugar phosphate isomerase/epimerase family protein [Streptomyces sp. NBC_00083]MCX5382321.1 sugar phosphate isomerase/epimerase [Streptomyces sp. NBC_00083]
MQLALSTLGLPHTPLPRVADLAARSGYHGVELRTHPEEPVHPALDAAQRRAVARLFEAAGVEILTLAAYARVADPADTTDLPELIHLASDLGAKYIRVFPGGAEPDTATDTGTGTSTADDTAVRRLAEAAPLAHRHGIRILLETHDSHRTGRAAARVLDRVDHVGAGALWDVMHTWLGGETPAESFTHLSPHLGYTQVKDIASAEDTTPLPLGAGVLPLPACVAPLPPDGWLCWEYEKRWYPRAAPLPGLLQASHDHLSRLTGR